MVKGKLISKRKENIIKRGKGWLVGGEEGRGGEAMSLPLFIFFLTNQPSHPSLPTAYTFGEEGRGGG